MMFGALVSAKRYLTSRMGEIDAALASYDPARDYAAREANVTSWTSKGEVLEASLGMFKWIEGATNRLFASSAITPVHFFELADQRVEVTMVASAEETERLFAHLREHRVHVFYARTPVEFGTIGEGDA